MHSCEATSALLAVPRHFWCFVPRIQVLSLECAFVENKCPQTRCLGLKRAMDAYRLVPHEQWMHAWLNSQLAHLPPGQTPEFHQRPDRGCAPSPCCCTSFGSPPSLWLSCMQAKHVILTVNTDCFPAHHQLGTCRTGLVSPKQPVSYIPCIECGWRCCVDHCC